MRFTIIFLICLFLISCGGNSVTDTSTLAIDIDGNDNGVYNEQTDFYLFENSNDKEAIIRITYKDKYGKAIQGNSVTLTTDSKEISFPMGNTVTTDSSGQATVLIRVEPTMLRTLTTTASIIATASDTKNAILLYLLPITVSPSFSAISATPEIVNTGDNAVITAFVKTNLNTTVPNGTIVNFTATCGSVTFSATTTAGVATATYTAPLTAPIDGMCKVTVSSTDITLGTVNLNIGIIDPRKSSITATPDTIVLEETSVITVMVKNNMGLLVPNGTIVNFTATCGTIPSSATTLNGVVTANFKAPTSLPANSKCSVTVSSSGIVIGTIDVNIIAKLTVTPASQTVNKTAGGVAIFTITGGIPAYTITSDNPSFKPEPAKVDESGGTFSVTIPANSVADTVTYTVKDSNERSRTAVLKIQ